MQLKSLTAHSFRVVSAEAVRTHWERGGEMGKRGKRGKKDGEQEREGGKEMVREGI